MSDQELKIVKDVPSIEVNGITIDPNNRETLKRLKTEQFKLNETINIICITILASHDAKGNYDLSADCSKLIPVVETKL